MSQNSSRTPVYSQPQYNKSNSVQGDTPSARPKLPRENTDQLLSYYQSSLADEGINYARPSSPDKAPVRAQPHTRQMSGGSTSSSDYSSDSEVSDPSTRNDDLVSVKRRSSVPSQGGADRRRVAIVQMESLPESIPRSASENGHSQNSIRSRRGLKANLKGLALVAPPDAAPKTYTHLTPPTTAPLTSDLKSRSLLPDTPSRDEKGHLRSASEVVPSKRTAPREIGIVGTAFQNPRDARLFTETEGYTDNEASDPPMLPKASTLRSPSPTRSAASEHPDYGMHLRSPGMSARSIEHPIVTPEIGESKEIHVPVAAPVVVNLDSASAIQAKQRSSTPSRKDNSTPQVVLHPVPASPFPPSEASSFLHYQPGVDAIAGPLPPPPRATFNIDIHAPPPPRPPRVHSPPPNRPRGDLDAVKQALQLPPSVSAVLASKSPKMPDTLPAVSSKPDVFTSVSEVPKSVHHREGAFPPSSSESIADEAPAVVRSYSPSESAEAAHDGNESVDESVANRSLEADGVDDDVPAVTVIAPLSHIHNQPLDTVPEQEKENNDTSSNADHDASPSQEDRRATSLDQLSSSPSSARSHSPPYGDTPSPPPKSFRNSLTNNLKRFSSLPRTPSISSRSARRSSSGTQHSSRTPSPSLHLQPPSPHRKIISQSPAAMYCNEVHGVKSTAERCAIYAAKINELYLYDCGLSAWVVESKYRDTKVATQRAPTSNPFTPQPRQTSRSSMISEATFPRRPDASTATDLSFRSHLDVTPPTAPPPLPYPSLALSQQRAHPIRSSSSATSGTASSSIRSLVPSTPTSKAGGFFASLGRKASISTGKRDKPGPATPISASSSSSGRMLTKAPPSSHNISRPILNISNPSVPGGPRAPSNRARAQRSQTLMTTITPFSSNPAVDRRDTLGRRPSMFNIGPDTVIDIKADPEFVRQVDKLVDLLPHADRDVLGGYLRRAGQDVLAIGQYLEDEKNGTIRSP